MCPSSLRSGNQYFRYDKAIKTYGNISGNLSGKYLSDKFSSSKWLYSKNLVGHTGCVNALAFSKNGGEFLVSGGDDRRVLMWWLCESMTRNTTPTCLKQQHQSNIFCVTFDHDNRHIISAGHDETIFYHDVESGEVLRSFEAEANTNEICLHPEDNNIFIAAESSFGGVTQFDLRTPAEQTVVAVPWPSEHTLSYWPNVPNFSSAKFNPVDPSVIVTGNLKNGVQLWDVRFPKRCLRHFDSSLKAGREIAMSVAFDYTGRYIAAVRKTHPPVLYHIDRDACLAEFHEKGYGNTVTRKSVCFAGQKDEFIMTGSEDFNVYLWKVPKLSKDHVGIAVEKQSFLTLRGHRSIVNQACFNRDTAMICSSGVEKVIKMWSPFQMVDGIPGDKRCQKRKLYTHEEYYGMLDEDWPFDDDCTTEDHQMLAMVDQWLLQPQQDILNDSESDEDPPIEHVGVFVDEIRRENLYFNELSYDSEISQSDSETTDSETKHSRDTNPNNDQFLENFTGAAQCSRTPDRISENVTTANTENVRTLEISSQSGNRHSENVASSERNSQSRENASLSFHLSGGVEVQQFSTQDRLTNSLKRIAELRRNCLRDDD